jgi:hypothetical protein
MDRIYAGQPVCHGKFIKRRIKNDFSLYNDRGEINHPTEHKTAWRSIFVHQHRQLSYKQKQSSSEGWTVSTELTFSPLLNFSGIKISGLTMT